MCARRGPSPEPGWPPVGRRAARSVSRAEDSPVGAAARRLPSTTAKPRPAELGCVAIGKSGGITERHCGATGCRDKGVLLNPGAAASSRFLFFGRLKSHILGRMKRTRRRRRVGRPRRTDDPTRMNLRLPGALRTRCGLGHGPKTVTRVRWSSTRSPSIVSTAPTSTLSWSPCCNVIWRRPRALLKAPSYPCGRYSGVIPDPE